MWFQEVSDKFLKILARGFKETSCPSGGFKAFQEISGGPKGFRKDFTEF